MKLDTSFYRHTLLPNLFKARQSGVDTLSKSALLAHFQGHEAEKLWVCCASAKDLEETAEIVNAMLNEKHDVIADLQVTQNYEHTLSDRKLLKVVSSLRKGGQNELASKLFDTVVARQKSDIDNLSQVLWKANLKMPMPDKASDADVQVFAKQAADYLQEKTNADADLIHQAVVSFIDQNYWTDPDFKGTPQPTKILAADLYYKNRGDELDDLEVSSEISAQEIELGMRELKRFI